MYKVIFSLVLLVYSTLTNAIPLIHLDAYAALDFGSYGQKEQSGRYDHSADTYGAELGARAGIELFGIIAGGLYSVSKHHFDTDRTDTKATVNNVSSYNNNWTMQLTGGFAGIRLPVFPIRIWGEYYGKARAYTTYAGPDGANPYKENDYAEGNGFGFGAGLEAQIFYFGLLYRSVKFNRFGLQGSNSVADDSLGKMTFNSLSIQTGVTF